MGSKFEFDASQYDIKSVTIYRDGGAKVRFSHLILNIETTKWLTLWLYLQVYRKFELSHKGGRYEVQIINLPSCIQEVSARVRFDNSQVAAVQVIRHEKREYISNSTLFTGMS